MNKYTAQKRLPETILGKATKETAKNINVDEGASLLSFVGAAATVTQGRYQVELPTGQIKPLSQAILIAADSGERKSALMDIAIKPLRDIEKKNRNEYKQQLSTWKVEKELWMEERRSIMKSIYKSEKKGLCSLSLRSKLSSHILSEPIKPIKKKFIFEDSTSASMLKSLSEELPFGSLMSSEGHLVLNSKLFDEFGVMNKLWDQEPVTITRANQTDIEIDGATLSSLIMVQPGILKNINNKNGVIIRDSGLWSRYLVYNPPRHQGARFLSHNPSKSWIYTEKILTRISELATESLNAHEVIRPEKITLKYTPEANQLFVDFHNDIERRSGPNGDFDGINDLASKLSQNAGRMAANLHLLDKKEGAITSDSLLLAIDVCLSCSEHFRSFFSPAPQEWQDAIALDEWLESKRQIGVFSLGKNYARRCCPNMLRGKRFYRALDILTEHYRVSFFTDSGKAILNIIPAVNSKPLEIWKPGPMFTTI